MGATAARIGLALAAAVLAAPAIAWAQDYVPAGLSGFPPHYFFPCDQAPKAAVVNGAGAFNQFMRVLCTTAGHALGPPPGVRWAFNNGTTGFLSALSTNSKVTGPAAYFTRLDNAPLSSAEALAFRARLTPIVGNPTMLAGSLIRLDLETSTGDHRQEYFFVNRAASGAMTPIWGLECFKQCDPMENPPWAFEVVADKP